MPMTYSGLLPVLCGFWVRTIHGFLVSLVRTIVRKDLCLLIGGMEIHAFKYVKNTKSRSEECTIYLGFKKKASVAVLLPSVKVAA